MLENIFFLYNSAKLIIYHIYLYFRGLSTLHEIVILKSKEYIKKPKYNLSLRHLIDDNRLLQECKNNTLEQIIEMALTKVEIRSVLVEFYTNVREDLAKEKEKKKEEEREKDSTLDRSKLDELAKPRLNCCKACLSKYYKKNIFLLQYIWICCT